MKRLFTIGVIVLLGHIAGASHAQAGENVDQAWVTQNLTSMPLAFTKNMGQWDERALFRADAGGATMWITTEGVYYQFTRWIPGNGNPPQAVGHPDDSVGRNQPASGGFDNPLGRNPRGFDMERDSIETMVITARFVGANPNPIASGGNLMDYKCNYFLGNDPSKWRTDVPNYEAITLEEVYPGIDLTYYGNGHQMEYDFVVSPGADYSQIQIQYEGAEGLAIADDGALVVTTAWGEIKELAPVVYQELGGSRRPVASEYVVQSDHTFGFRLGKGYDRDLPVVIDPVLVYSTYLGGNYSYDEVNSIAVDLAGSAYVTGCTWYYNFPTTPEAYDTSYNGRYDAFVTKLSPAGTNLVYSTYLGGSGIVGDDFGNGIAVDGAGCAYVTGSTSSTNFPTLNPYQGALQYGDAFVTKFSSGGNSLVYSTYLGGTSTDYGYGIAVDGAGSAYVTGRTESTDFPTVTPFDGSLNGSYDAFVTKLSPAGNSLVYSTYLGGSSYDNGRSIAVDGAGSAYVTGWTESADFPTITPFDGSSNGAPDAFVTKLSPSGNSLVYSTYLGGSSGDYGYGIAVDGVGSAYVTGYTISADFPTAASFDGIMNGYSDAFVTKLSPAGNSLTYSTYLGGSGDDGGCGIAVDGAGSAYVTGVTSSVDFPTATPFDGTFNDGTYDAFVTKLNSAGNNLVYSSYLGGSGDDRGWCIAVDGSGSAYVTGRTESTDFPTATPFDGTYNGSTDAFVTKLSAEGGAAPHIAVSPGSLTFEAVQNGSVPASQSFTITNTSGGTLNWYVDEQISWLDLDVWQGTSNSAEVTASINTTSLTVGTHNGTMTVTSSNADNSPQAVNISYEIIQPMSMVSGFVFDKQTTGTVPYCSVELWQDGSVKYSVSTDYIGHYSFGSIPSGDYLLKAGLTGYYSSERSETFDQGVKELAPIFLYATSLYQPTAALKTAFAGFRDAYVDYLQGEAQCVIKALDFQFSLLHSEAYASGNSLARGIWEGFQAPTAEGLADIAKGKGVGTLADNLGALLYWSWLNSEIDETRQTYLTALQNGSPPLGQEYLDKPFVEMRERPTPRVKTMSELISEVQASGIASLPDYVLNGFPLGELTANIQSITEQVQQTTTTDAENPLEKEVTVTRWIPGQCNLSNNTSTTLGNLGRALRGIKQSYSTTVSEVERRERMTVVCDASSLGQTLLGVSWLDKLNEKIGSYWSAVNAGCDLGLFLSDVLITSDQTSLAINLNSFVTSWPGCFADHVRFYEQAISDVNSALANPALYNCSGAYAIRGYNLPGGCYDEGQDHVTISGSISVQNMSPSKNGTVYVYGDIYRVPNVFGMKKSKVGSFRGPQLTLGPMQTGNATVQYTLPAINLFWDPSSLELQPNLMTSDGPAPLSACVVTTIPSTLCATQQAFRETKNLISSTIDNLQDVTSGFKAKAGSLWGSVRAKWPGSDLDLHVYDLSSRHVGKNYAAGTIDLDIPGSLYTSDQWNEEEIWLPMVEGDSFTVVVHPVDLPNSEWVNVDVIQTLTAPPLAMLGPDSLMIIAYPGDSLTCQFSLYDLSGQNSIAVTGCTFDSLTDSGGGRLQFASLGLLHPSVVPPGNTGSIEVRGRIAADAALGMYEATLHVTTTAGLKHAPVRVSVVKASCCAGRVGDANGSNEPTDEVSLGDIMLMVDAKFISGDCSKLPCIAEADVNQDGGATPTCEEHVTLGDIMTLVDFLFITGPETAILPDCL